MTRQQYPLGTKDEGCAVKFICQPATAPQHPWSHTRITLQHLDQNMSGCHSPLAGLEQVQSQGH